MIPLWFATLFMIVYLICYVIYHWKEENKPDKKDIDDGKHD